jgi:hypothetical protein
MGCQCRSYSVVPGTLFGDSKVYVTYCARSR